MGWSTSSHHMHHKPFPTPRCKLYIPTHKGAKPSIVSNTFVHMFITACVYIYIHIHTYIYIHSYLRIYVYLNMCMNLYDLYGLKLYTYIHTYIHTYISAERERERASARESKTATHARIHGRTREWGTKRNRSQAALCYIKPSTPVVGHWALQALN